MSSSGGVTSARAEGMKLHLVPGSNIRAAIPPHPPYVFMAWRFIMHRDKFISNFVKFVVEVRML
jgi:hypothetical protein